MPVILSQLHRAFDIPSVLPKAGLSEIRHEAGKREWGSAARAFRGQRVYPSTVRAGCCIAGGASRLRAANSSTAATCSRAARRTRHTPFRPPGWLRSARQLLRTAARRSRQGLPRRINILLDTCTIPWLQLVPARVPEPLRRMLRNAETRRYSSAAAWEIAISGRWEGSRCRRRPMNS